MTRGEKEWRIRSSNKVYAFTLRLHNAADTTSTREKCLLKPRAVLQGVVISTFNVPAALMCRSDSAVNINLQMTDIGAFINLDEQRPAQKLWPVS